METQMVDVDTRNLPRRDRAHPFDHAQPSVGETRGHDASREAIGGFYGSEWEQYKTVADTNRYMLEGRVGTIGGTPVVVDPEYIDDLPPVGDFDGWEPRRTGRAPVADPRHEPTRFEGVIAAAFAKAGLTAKS